jgi:DivIVA protein
LTCKAPREPIEFNFDLEVTRLAEREHQTPDADVAVTPAELRAPNLTLQPLGGYSRAETNRLLDRAAKSLEESSSSTQTQISSLQAALDLANRRLAEEASREPASVEQAVGEVLVTAHRAAEVVRIEAKQEADALLVAARAEAQELLAEAKRQTEELEAANARVEDTLVKAQEEARASREDAQREIAELHAEAHRVRLVIDEFRSEWWTLISDALRKLELRFPNADASADTAESLPRTLPAADTD